MPVCPPRSAAAKYKVVLLGESGVGKSALAQRLVKNEWSEHLNSTVGASFFRYACPVDETTVMFDLWDTAGQERYKSLASMYYRGAAGAIIVYDITSYDSFECAKYWVRELTTSSADTVIALVGNKLDLEANRRVSAEDGRRYAASLDLTFAEASARNGCGVRDPFEAVGRKLLEINSANNVREGGVVGRTERAGEADKKTCC